MKSQTEKISNKEYMPIRGLAHGKYHYERAADSVLGLVLFNIFVHDLFPFIKNSQF